MPKINLESTTQAFADYLGKEGIRFVLIGFDGENVTFNAFFDDEVTPESPMPSVIREVMEADAAFAQLMTYAFVQYVKRNGQPFDPKLN